ncbi:MAG: VWA domain-containing protein [Deltaproteobacteria bacterium]|nr:VWA domain-containing protein [Deltaproteobacteria bacterium]
MLHLSQRPSLQLRRFDSIRRLAVALGFVGGLVMALLSPHAAALGILVPTAPGLSNVELVNHRVDVTITERGAKTHVVQTFRNNTGRILEATYIFPLPKGASIDEYALWMNGKREVGKVMERNKARQIYESIVRRQKDPGLIEYIDGELFQARVFPVPAKGEMKIELVYSHLVDYNDGTHRYVYPLKTDANASHTLEDFTLTVHLKNKLPIRNLYSPTHKVAAKKKGKTAIASFEKNAASLADDFVLYWSVDDKDVGVTVLTYQEGDKPGYFMMLASPKDGFRSNEIIGKRVSFVVDTSGSMMGEKMDATKNALDYCLSQLGEDDIFNVHTYGGYVENFSGKMLSASSSNVKRARDFVRQIEPLGGTNIEEALDETFKHVSGSKKAPHMVVFLSDGRPTIGETDIKTLTKKSSAINKSNARIFTFGVGDDVNTVLLDKIAENNGGLSTYVSGDASLEKEVKRFYDAVSHPVLSNLKLDVEGVRLFGTHPRRLPDLFKGGQLVLLGRYRGQGQAKIALSGQTHRGKRVFRYRGRFTKSNTEHEFIPRLWAQRQVGMLLQEIRDSGEERALIDEVTQLATAFGIVTPYTSYLVVEPNAQVVRRPTLRPNRVPRRGDRKERPRAAPGLLGGEGLGAFAPAEMEADDASSMTSGAGGSAKGSGPRKKVKASLRDKSGGSAVAAAREIGRLKEEKLATRQRVRTTKIRAIGRTFSFKKGYFVDDTSKSSDKTLHIRPYSDAFFAVLKLRPDLKRALLIGEKVKVRVGKGRTLVMDPKGQRKVAAAKLKRFMKK